MVLNSTEWGPKKIKPFHAAEQHSKEWRSDSAERKQLSDVARSLRAAEGSSIKSNQVIGCPFGFVFGQAKMNKKMN
jgi:hypothetical protein